jgi:hypothetical protein
MGWKETKCYHCGEQALEKFVDVNFDVRCQSCNSFYELSNVIYEYFCDRKNNQLIYKKVPLTPE